MLSLKIAGLAREKMNLMHQAFELTKISVHKGKCNREGIYTHRWTLVWRNSCPNSNRKMQLVQIKQIWFKQKIIAQGKKPRTWEWEDKN